MITHEVPSKLRSILSRAVRIPTDDENSNNMVIMSEDRIITDFVIEKVNIFYKMLLIFPSEILDDLYGNEKITTCKLIKKQDIL